jgi:hypothetical protein
MVDYKKNNMSTDREKGRGNERARVITETKARQKIALHCAQTQDQTRTKIFRDRNTATQ